MKTVFHRRKPVPTVKRPNNNFSIRQDKKKKFALLLDSRRLKEKMVS